MSEIDSALGIRHSALVIAGPTGVGKSRLALRLAEEIGGEVVNFDSVQIYRGFDIGSAKPTAGERARVPHHLIDIVDAEDEFNAADFAARARAVVDDVGCVEIILGVDDVDEVMRHP